VDHFNFLVAYPYLDVGLIQACADAASKGHKFWMDSGAFTTYKANKAATPVDEFANFVKTFPIKPDRIFTLDVIGDPIKTEENYRYLSSQGIDTIPIATPGAKPYEIASMYEHSDLVAVGGINTNKGAGGGGLGWAKHVLETNKKPVHLLGSLNKSLIAKYKPYSADASTWEYGARMGHLPLYVGKGKTVVIARTDLKTKITDEQADAIKSYGYTLKDARAEESWHGGQSMSRFLGAQSTLRFAADCQRLFNTKVVLSLTTTKALRIVLEAYDREQALKVTSK